MKAEIKPDFEEINATESKANQEKTEAVVEHQEVPDKEATVKTIGAPKDRTMDQEPVVDTTTDGKGRPRMLYEEPLKDRSSRRDVWHS
jgi:hypothetical protein